MAATESLDLLLVEDNPGDARLIEELLIDAQHENRLGEGEVDLHHADRLADGLDHLDGTDVDVVLLDLNLPDSRGMETLTAVLDRVEAIPVIVLTGFPESELGTRAVQRGAQDYLAKDEVTADSLARAIQYARERKKSERELHQRTEELAILNQVMRHDIRNDVSLIVGRGQELAEYVDPRGEDLLAEVLTASNHVLQLTRTIGDTVEAITSDEVPLEPVALDDVLASELSKARRLYSNAVIEVDGELPSVEVRANELLSSVFANLLSNATLYTDRQVPEVRVSVEPDDEQVAVRVADNGPGVPDHLQDQIFGRDTASPESGGLGIGLYLVDQLVDQYDGEVWIEDNEPQGAVFVVELERA